MSSSDARPKIFITGSDGFIGPHLLTALRTSGFECVAAKSHLNSSEGLSQELKSGPWDMVIHLAAMSSPKDCARDPAAAYETNTVGTLTLAKLCAEIGFKGLFLFFSTSYVYSPEIEGEISEDQATEPSGVYGRSKLFAERSLQDIAKTVDYSVLTLRLFNHAHKSQRGSFFLPSIYETLLKLAKNSNSEVLVPMGDPELQRDFNTIQDLKTAVAQIAKDQSRLVSLLRRDHDGFLAVNMCSGQPRKLGTLVHLLGSKLGLDAVPDPQVDRMRHGEPRILLGNPALLNRLLGRHPLNRSDAEFADMFMEDLP